MVSLQRVQNLVLQRDRSEGANLLFSRGIEGTRSISEVLTVEVHCSIYLVLNLVMQRLSERVQTWYSTEGSEGIMLSRAEFYSVIIARIWQPVRYSSERRDLRVFNAWEVMRLRSILGWVGFSGLELPMLRELISRVSLGVLCGVSLSQVVVSVIDLRRAAGSCVVDVECVLCEGSERAGACRCSSISGMVRNFLETGEKIRCRGKMRSRAKDIFLGENLGKVGVEDVLVRIMVWGLELDRGEYWDKDYIKRGDLGAEVVLSNMVEDRWVVACVDARSPEFVWARIIGRVEFWSRHDGHVGTPTAGTLARARPVAV
nr:hypothetical protein Iba_chr06aCG11480 [Ipomoea batatas]